MAVVATPSVSRLAGYLSRRGIHYGWLMVGITFLSLLITAAVRSMPGVLILPFEAEFHWTRAEITTAVSINLLLFGVCGPIVGRWMDRSGPRIVGLASIILMILGGLGTTVMTQVWQLDLFWGLIVGAGAGGMAMVMVASVVSRWFQERRGLATGILGTASSTGQIIFIPIIMWLSVTVGWRVGIYLAVGLLALIVVPLYFFLFRDDPKQVGLRRVGESTDVARAAAQAALAAESTPMSRVARSPDFWWLAGGFFVCGYTTNGLIGTHFISHAAEHGIDQVAAASIFGLMGAVNILGTIAAGMLADRIQNRRYLLASLYLFRGLSLLALPFMSGSPTSLAIFSILYGLNWFATAPVNQLLVADLFGRRSVGQVYGWVFFSHQVGSALAALLGGMAHVAFGDYQVAFLSAGLAGIAAAGFSLQVRERQRQPAVQPVPA